MNRMGVSKLGVYNVKVGGGLSVQTVAYIAAMTVKPSLAQEIIIDNRIKHLITTGVWDKLYQLCFFDIHNPTAALLNAKNPSQSCTNYGAEHVAGNGYKVDSSTKYIDSGINPSLIPNATHTNFSYGAYCPTVSPYIGPTYMVACSDSNGIQCAFSPAFAALTVRASLGSNGGALNYTLPNADYTGYFVVTRSGELTTDIKCYQKGVELVRGASNAGSALPNNAIYYLSINYNGVATGSRVNEIIKAVHIGKNMSQSEAKALNDAIVLYPWS